MELVQNQEKYLTPNIPPIRPDYQYVSDFNPRLFKKTLLDQGAIMFRNAVNVDVLNKINNNLFQIYEEYSQVRKDDFDRHLLSNDPLEKDFWQQIQLGHIYDSTFKKFSGFSYFDIIKKSSLWDLAVTAWPEYTISESHVCGSRRIDGSQKKYLWDEPINFHVDAQYHCDEILTLNFWTPLISCGVDAPGLKVILMGVEDTKNYLEYNPAGYEAKPGDYGRMHKFRIKKMEKKEIIRNHLDSRIWSPTFNVGDILVLTNYTMHATHFTDEMIEPRTSIEVRINLY